MLKAEMFVRVTMDTGSSMVPAIPQSAVHVDEGQTFVLVEKEKGNYERRPVKVGADLDGAVGSPGRDHCSRPHLSAPAAFCSRKCKMIDRIIGFSLHQRFIVLALAVLLTIGGIISFHRLPIEAYPDVADVEVDVITLWPGHAAEEVERHITIPIERAQRNCQNHFPPVDSNFGLSNIRVLFADGTDNYWARQQVQGAACPSRDSFRREAWSWTLSKCHRRSMPIHDRIKDHAARRTQGSSGLGARARVSQGPRRCRRRLLGAVSNSIKSRSIQHGSAPTISP